MGSANERRSYIVIVYLTVSAHDLPPYHIIHEHEYILM